MRIKNIDDKQYIILEENDQVNLVATQYGTFNSIEITNTDNGLTISGNASIIDKIIGDKMIEKVYIPPFLSSEEIIAKCDEWLEAFYKIHDTFSSLVTTNRYREENITMELNFPTYSSILDAGKRGKIISLELSFLGNTIQKGIYLHIDDNNQDIYNYLVANILDYYIQQHYKNEKIEHQNPSWNHNLTTSQVYPNYQKGAVPLFARLTSLYENHELAQIVTGIISNHNTGTPSNVLLHNLQDQIRNQQLPQVTLDDFEDAKKQYNYMEQNEDIKKLKKDNK